MSIADKAATAAVVARAIGDLADTIKKLSAAGDDAAAAEEALMQQAERNKERLDELKFPKG